MVAQPVYYLVCLKLVGKMADIKVSSIFIKHFYLLLLSYLFFHLSRWRTKQNLDFSYLMMYAQSRGKYYVQVNTLLGFIIEIEPGGG